MNLLILRMIARIHLYLITLFSIYLLIRGHNDPGGGFIAGLLTASAIVLQAIAFDARYAGRLIPVPETWMLGTGLAFAVGTGIWPALRGRPFLDHTFGGFDWGFFGVVELATAVIFDVGVYLVVVGVTKWVILSIAGEAQEGS